jgi:hypothetical protein
MLYFDRNDPLGLSQSGKPVPLEWEDGPSGNPHNCPNNPYNQGRNQPSTPRPTTQTARATVETVPTVAEKMDRSNILEILGKVEAIMARVDSMGQMIYNLDKKVTQILQRNDPLNDDGDSLRENPEAEDNA